MKTKWFNLFGIDIRFEFKLQDMWIGLYWEKSLIFTDIWICIIPTLPIHINIRRI